MGTFLAILETIGGVVGTLITIGTFITIIAKKPKELIGKFLIPIIKESNRDMDEKLTQGQAEIMERLKASDENDIVGLRHSITGIYYKYKDQKQLPAYVKQDLLSLYERYEKLGGNSFVHSLVEEMKTWDIE